MIAGLFAIFIAALLAPMLRRWLKRGTGWALAAVPAAVFIDLALRVPAIAGGEHHVESYIWSSELSLAFALRLDGLSLLFGLLITGIGALVVAYAGKYLEDDDQLGWFFMYLMGFMGAMHGLVLADDLILLYVFWELTTITSFLLIGYYHREEAARNAALQALLVTTIGGFAMLAGFVLLGFATGTMRISEILAMGDAVRGHALYLPILVLVLAGAFTKSAMFPFHFWLPNAMEAPTPVSAYLHSSTMVQAGVFLLARLNPALSGTEAWMYALVGFGGFTMLLGSLLALKTSDLKRVLAYATVSALGLLVMLLGMGTEYAIFGMTAYLLAHALYKGALFLVAGIIYHETGVRDAEEANGLVRAMPLTAVFAALAGASMAGLPPMIGFFGKELVLEAVNHFDPVRQAILVASIVAMGFLAAASLLAAFKPFWGWRAPAPKAHEAPFALLLGPGLLAVIGVAMGLGAQWTVEWFIAPTMHAIMGRPPERAPAVYYALNLALLYSAIALGAGVLLYALRRVVQRVWRGFQALWFIDPEHWYGGSLSATMWTAGFQTRLLQHGYLRQYVLVTVIATVAIVGTAVFTGIERVSWAGIADVLPHEIAIAIIAIGGTIMVVRSTNMLGAVAALGAVGFATTLIFAFYSAPDLAMTQFVFETMVVILLVLVLYRLPKLERYTSSWVRLRDAAVACSFGVMMSLLVLMALDVDEHPVISKYFVENAVPLAHGHNVVNVILVDFRSFDTLGELVVLALGGVGVYTLLRLRPRKGARRESAADSQARRAEVIATARQHAAADRRLDLSEEPGPVDRLIAGSSPEPEREPAPRLGEDVKAGPEAQPGPLPSDQMPLTSHVFQASVHLFLPLLLTYSLVVLLRGHNHPGGGFIGGLVAAASLAMHAIAYSPRTTQRLLRIHRHTLIAAGLALAAGSGVVGLLMGDPFLTGHWVTVTMPLLDPIKLGTPLLFDTGVFLLVIGAGLLVIFSAAEE